MSDATLAIGAGDPAAAAAPKRTRNRVSIAAIAWRNLWRSKSRTWLMAGGIGFAGLLVMSINSLQIGTFTMTIDASARFFAGHVQVQHPDYLEDPRPDHVVRNAAAKVEALEQSGEFDGVAPRALAFALLAAADADAGGAESPAVGGLVVGVDTGREFAAIREQPATGALSRGAGRGVRRGRAGAEPRRLGGRRHRGAGQFRARRRGGDGGYRRRHLQHRPSRIRSLANARSPSRVPRRIRPAGRRSRHRLDDARSSSRRAYRGPRSATAQPWASPGRGCCRTCTSWRN